VLTCTGGTCTLLNDAMVFANGSYSVYVNAQGAGGYSIDGPHNNGYAGPVDSANTSEPGDFVLDFAVPQLVTKTNMTASYSGGRVNVSFEGVEGGTWYNIWIGTANAVQTFHYTWYSSTTLNCQGGSGTTCTVSIPLNLSSGQYYLGVQSAGPGGYSVGGIANNGFQVMDAPFSVP
jgi:hypothetical protein